MKPDNRSQSSEAWGLDIGVHVPSFTATDYKGNVIHLDDLQGQRRILVFILPGCTSCVDAINVLNAELSDRKDLTTLMIGGSNREQNIAYGLEHKASMPVLTFTPGFDNELYRIRGVPFAFAIDEAGIIRAKGILHDPEHLRHLLAKAFASLPIMR